MLVLELELALRNPGLYRLATIDGTDGNWHICLRLARVEYKRAAMYICFLKEFPLRSQELANLKIVAKI